MFNHIPVLLNETIDGLKIEKNKIYIDLTLGGGGHAMEVLNNLKFTGKLIAFDQDEESIKYCKKKFENYKNIILINENFENFDRVLKELNIKKVDGIYADLGVSSVQFDTKERGFSYNQDFFLDMRMDKRNTLTAYDIVNTFSEIDIYHIIKNNSNEIFAKNIAKHIVNYRKNKKIETSFELVDIIKESIPAKIREKKGHPAKKTFQALRIEVNRELEILENTLNKMVNALNDKARLCIISFHSLEDIIVKEKFKQFENPCTCPKNYPCICGKKSLGKIITRKAITPSIDEINTNRRSKSAKLRIFERQYNL